MKKKNDVWKRYIEAFVGSTILVMGMFLCTSGQIFVKMVPIAFLIGILGVFIFGKRVMTSCFCFIMALILLQMKLPSQLLSNIIIATQIAIGSALGEVCGVYIKEIKRLLKLKKKKVNEIVKKSLICVAILVVALEVNGIVNGSFLGYMKAKKSLQNYFIEEYSSSSRFEIVSSKFVYTPTARYVFYTQDVLSNNEAGRFIVYANDSGNVLDDYKEQILRNEADNISDKIQNIDNEDFDVELLYEDVNVITISFNKLVENINKEAVEVYAKQIVKYIEKAKEIPEFSSVEQIKIVLESKNDSKEDLASYIYMEGYNQMIANNTEEPYEYIIKALNVEYFE